MKKNILCFGLAGLSLMAVSCKSGYTMSDISRSRIVVDQKYDGQPDRQAVAFLEPYTRQVDIQMRPVVGQLARYMASNKPESELSNLLTDILLWSGKHYDEQPDFAVYNMGGIRAAMNAGAVDLGDILDVAPFENKISFFTLSGKNTLELFRQIAANGGEGLSHGVEMEITKDGKLRKVLLNGKPIDESGSYRVATLDYLAQGNDGLSAFKTKIEVNEPKSKADNVRELIAAYFKEKAAEGVVVDSKIEGRIKIVE